ncbi:MAG TPA: hypothetical protein VJZ27_03685 [Aggregatilineales bacterium]|nr:hypothetical protein [Aggregatilineales bacterium]
MSAENLDLIAGWASLVLTLMIFSYLLSDNFLYRIAVHILVGATAGFAVIVAAESVILPWLDLTLLAEGSDANIGFRILSVIPFILGISLLLKQTTRFTTMGNPGLAFLIGAGTAVAIVGAITGTIIPLTRDAGQSFERQNFFNGMVMVLGTIGTLVYFQYLAKRQVDGSITRSLLMRLLAGTGQVFVAITFGAMYAGVVITSLSVFDGVVRAQLDFLLRQIG